MTDAELKKCIISLDKQVNILEAHIKVLKSSNFKLEHKNIVLHAKMDVLNQLGIYKTIPQESINISNENLSDTIYISPNLPELQKCILLLQNKIKSLDQQLENLTEYNVKLSRDNAAIMSKLEVLNQLGIYKSENLFPIQSLPVIKT